MKCILFLLLFSVGSFATVCDVTVFSGSRFFVYKNLEMKASARASFKFHDSKRTLYVFPKDRTILVCKDI